MRRLQRIPASHGTLFWWDHEHKEVIFLIASDQHKPGALEERIALLAAHIGASEALTGGPDRKYRVVEFNSPLVPLAPRAEQQVPLPNVEKWVARHV